jgi:hypothetical protein
MYWDNATLQRLDQLFAERWSSMRDEKRTDRKNLSCHWNRYLKQYEVRVIRCGDRRPDEDHSPYVGLKRQLEGIIELINRKNDEVSNGLIINNPDRIGQYILIQRDMAERILVFGMI